MSSLDANFNELIERVKAGREFGHASFEPIFYLVFSPDQILKVKRQMPAWLARLKNEGWTVSVFSLAHAIREILGNEPLMDDMVEIDAQAPLEWEDSNQALSELLTKGAIQAKLEQAVEKVAHVEKAIVLVTDLESLHPYMRIGAIESQLQGKFNIPTIFFYPGVRTGKTQLKFLGFYPEDGNYRSVHVGG